MLTDKERALIEKNHNLIYKYLGNKRLDESEWYGLLAETMCKVIPKYNPQYKLAPYLWRCWDNAIANEVRKNKQKTVPLDEVEAHSYDYNVDDILDNEANELRLWVDGYSIREISKMTGYSTGTVHKKIANARNKIKKELLS